MTPVKELLMERVRLHGSSVQNMRKSNIFTPIKYLKQLQGKVHDSKFI